MATSELKLKLETRADSGSGSSKRLRKEGKIPTVVYGHSKNPKHCTVQENDWRTVAKSDAQVIKILVDKAKRPMNVLVREVQHDYLNNKTLHIDLQEINMNEEITATVPINAVGTAAGTKMGGILDQVYHELEVSCLPNELPDAIEVDVSELELDSSLHLSEITLPEGVTTSIAQDQVLFHVAEPRVKQETEEAEGGAENEAEKATEEKAEE